MEYNNDKARREICSHIISKYNKIEVKPGRLLFNFRCHNNAVHFAKKGKHKKLVMCVYIEDNTYPVVHFINYKKGVFTDNTLGEWTTQFDYYFIKWIEDDEMWNIFDIFDAFKCELGNTLNWWTRLTSNYRA